MNKVENRPVGRLRVGDKVLSPTYNGGEMFMRILSVHRCGSFYCVEYDDPTTNVAKYRQTYYAPDKELTVLV